MLCEAWLTVISFLAQLYNAQCVNSQLNSYLRATKGPLWNWNGIQICNGSIPRVLKNHDIYLNLIYFVKDINFDGMTKRDLVWAAATSFSYSIIAPNTFLCNTEFILK